MVTWNSRMLGPAEMDTNKLAPLAIAVRRYVMSGNGWPCAGIRAWSVGRYQLKAHRLVLCQFQ